MMAILSKFTVLFSAISRMFIGGGSLNPLQIYSQCILRPKPTGPYIEIRVLSGVKVKERRQNVWKDFTRNFHCHK